MESRKIIESTEFGKNKTEFEERKKSFHRAEKKSNFC